MKSGSIPARYLPEGYLSVSFPYPSLISRLFRSIGSLLLSLSLCRSLASRMDAPPTALNVIQGTESGNTPLNFIAVRVEAWRTARGRGTGRGRAESSVISQVLQATRNRSFKRTRCRGHFHDNSKLSTESISFRLFCESKRRVTRVGDRGDSGSR